MSEELEQTVSQEVIVTPVKKKRGRPAKAPVVAARQFRCSTCQESYTEDTVMKIGAGDNGRSAIFCPSCAKSLGFFDQVLEQQIADLVRNNPTGKLPK